jgi:hypothetical protein
MSNDNIISQLKAAITQDPATRAIGNQVRIREEGGQLVIEGPTPSIAVKRATAVLAQRIAGAAVDDRLWVEPAMANPDDKLLAEVGNFLQEEEEFRNLVIKVWEKGRQEILQQPDDASGGQISIKVENGNVIFDGAVESLAHKRLLEGVTWWIPGVRNVTNHLTVSPSEADSDTDISDALTWLLGMDSEIPDGQVSISTKDQVVRLEGLLFDDGQKRKAEQDAWSIWGVNGVVNNIQVQHP